MSIESAARKLAAAFVFLCFALAGWSQTGSFQGKVKGPDGAPLKDALVKIERLDIKGNYKVKTNRKGEFFHAGLPLGNYKITLEVDGKDVDTVNNIRTRLGDPVDVDFDLAAMRKKQEALQRAAETGTLTQEQSRELTPEQRAAMEKQVKERSQTMAKNKALNDAFNGGMAALQSKQWDLAIESFTKACELDAKQHVVWANLAESLMGRMVTRTGAEQQADVDKGIEAYNKAIELKPDDAAYHNNFGLALARARKTPEAQAELTKAAQLDPAKAGTYFYNLGAVLTNTGQNEAAGDAFKKAVESDPNHPGALYQYGSYLIGKSTTTPDGKFVPPPGTKEAFQKYLAIEPNGLHAEGAKGMLAAIEGTVTTSYESPEQQKKKAKKK